MTESEPPTSRPSAPPAEASDAASKTKSAFIAGKNIVAQKTAKRCSGSAAREAEVDVTFLTPNPGRTLREKTSRILSIG